MSENLEKEVDLRAEIISDAGKLGLLYPLIYVGNREKVFNFVDKMTEKMMKEIEEWRNMVDIKEVVICE